MSAKYPTHSATPSTQAPRAALLAAAIAGLSGVWLPACESETTSDEPAITSTKVDEAMTYDKFAADCDKQGGFVQTHAVCSGNNSCRGFSYNKYSYKLTEHTCKGMNSCGGMSCVLTPEDGGRKGSEVYEASCSGCHTIKEKTFTYYVAPGTDLVAAAAAFAERKTEVQASIVAFGTLGVNENGTSYTNMPAFHEEYSRAEIERAVDYIHTLDITAEEYGIVGITEEIGDASEM